MKFFSIIIPNYNNAPWLRRCLNSVLAQKFTDYEVIIVDDMSTDDSCDIIEQYARDFRERKIPVSTYRCGRKRYNGGTRNRGLLFSSSQYVLYMDSDDCYADDMCLTEIYNALVANNMPDLLRYNYLLCKDGSEQLVRLSDQKTIAQMVSDVNVACWLKCVKHDKAVKFPENTLMEDVAHHIAQLDNVQTVATLDKAIIKWNRDNMNSCSTNKEQQNGKWRSSLYRYYADLLDLQVEKPECQAELDKRRAKALFNIQNNIFEQG